jgi:Zn-finger nucleic acid-binding protein
MNCANCGAPMELFDRRRYYFCRHCGTFHFIEAEAHDGVRVLERRDVARPCPLCETPLAHSQLDDMLIVEHCERCRGVLMARQTFGQAVTLRRARATGPGVPPLPLDQRELQRQLYCPSCRMRMDVHPYYGPGNIVIDSCTRCDLIWLDHGELKLIADAPGADRGVRASASTTRPVPDDVLRPVEVRRMSVIDLLDDLFG